MPGVYLSDCGNETQEFCNGAKEGDVMNAILKQLTDYLAVSGLEACVRPCSVPAKMVSSLANKERANLLFLLRSGSGKPRVIGRTAEDTHCVCYHPRVAPSRQAAELLCAELSRITPYERKIHITPTPNLPDFSMSKCPGVQVRLGCRDDMEDAQWMTQSVGVIAHTLAKSITAWFGVPCKSPFAHIRATVHAPAGQLALRVLPEKNAPVVRQLLNGTPLTLFHKEGDWQYAESDGTYGFCLRRFLAPEKPEFFV
jgi:hypothetical protein